MNLLKKVAFLGVLSLVTEAAFAQHEGWHLKDKEKDGYYGISLDKAYDFLKSTNRKPTTVTVGVVDSGIDTAHVDLKNMLWCNTKEIRGNGRDDDKNGYVDDMHGWNFLGNAKNTRNVTTDSYEMGRVYWGLKDRFENVDIAKLSKKDKALYADWSRAKTDVMKNKRANVDINGAQRMLDNFKQADSIVRVDLGKDVYSCKDLDSYKPSDNRASRFVGMLLGFCGQNGNNDISNEDLIGYLVADVAKMKMTVEAPEDFRAIVGDDYHNFKDRFYGNSNVYVNDHSAVHGTHVAGIIGAERNNGIGMDGVVDQVRLLGVRAVPDGDEHDKDIALAIRYAVDNGAKVINMSFGKGYSLDKKWVDDAVKYAYKKGVLLVHAAGNDAKNIDTIPNYPTPVFSNKKRARNWITVGASGDAQVEGLVASFSNYGKNEVDVFAPGVQIYSTVPGQDTYKSLQGTSMAAPVVSGIAALIMSYYPELKVEQVKDIIERSVVIPQGEIRTPGTGLKVQLSDLSRTGGIVNAYEAVKLADSFIKK